MVVDERTLGAAMRRLDLSPTDLLPFVLTGAAAEELATVSGVPLVVLDLRGADGGDGPPSGFDPGALPTTVAARVDASTGPRWLALAHRCDVVLTPDGAALGDDRSVVTGSDADLARLQTAVLASPLAATALSLLLRTGHHREIESGLIAESTTYSMLQAGPEFLAWRVGRPAKALPGHEHPVLTGRDGSTLTVTLNRPDRHNAVDRGIRDGLAEALAPAVVDASIERIVLRGNGPSFSSGGDLDEFGSFPDPATSHATRLARSPARLLALLSDRVEAHLHGSCMGGGIELPAFAARVVADPSTRFALPEVRYGLVPGAGGTVSVTRRIGRHRTAWLGLTGAVIDAPTALAWGLIDAIDTP